MSSEISGSTEALQGRLRGWLMAHSNEEPPNHHQVAGTRVVELSFLSLRSEIKVQLSTQVPGHKACSTPLKKAQHADIALIGIGDTHQSGAAAALFLRALGKVPNDPAGQPERGILQ